MKNIIVYLTALIILAIAGCEKTEKNGPKKEDTYHTVLGKYGIKQNDIDEIYSYAESNEDAWLLASKDNKRWLSQYNLSTLGLVKQWNIPQNAAYNTINLPVATESGYIFTARVMHVSPENQDIFIVSAEKNKTSVDVIYTLSDKDWINDGRGPQHLNDLPKVELLGNNIHIHNNDASAPVFNELLLNNQGLVAADVAKTIIDDAIFITGFQNNKPWVGKYNNSTKEEVDTWKSDTELERTIPTNGGSDEYFIRSIMLDETSLIETSKGVCVVPRYSEEIGSRDLTRGVWEVYAGDLLFLNSDTDNIILGNTGFLSLSNQSDKEHYSLKKGEEPNLIFKIRGAGTSLYYSFIFSPEGELLEELPTDETF